MLHRETRETITRPAARERGQQPCIHRPHADVVRAQADQFPGAERAGAHLEEAAPHGAGTRRHGTDTVQEYVRKLHEVDKIAGTICPGRCLKSGKCSYGDGIEHTKGSVEPTAVESIPVEFYSCRIRIRERARE